MLRLRIEFDGSGPLWYTGVGCTYADCYQHALPVSMYHAHAAKDSILRRYNQIGVQVRVDIVYGGEQ